jgi:hypothetical protein
MRPWAVAAILGGAAAALYALTRRRREDTDERQVGIAARQIDGSDASAEFEAMIADENMVPERLP